MVIITDIRTPMSDHQSNTAISHIYRQSPPIPEITNKTVSQSLVPHRISIMSQPPSTILVLGASYAGLSITHYLLKHVLPSFPNHHIILVGASKQAMCRPACPRAMLSDSFFDQSKLFVDIDTQLASYPEEKATFVQGFVTSVDHEKRIATIKRGDNAQDMTIDFHALVIATGASTTSLLLSNGPDRAAAWKDFREELKDARRIVVAGAGPTGVEIAGELGNYVRGRGVDITLISSGSRILPAIRPDVANTAQTYLTDLSVNVLANTKVERHDSATKTLILSTGDLVENVDMYISATGTTPNTSFLSISLLAVDGRVRTNPSTLRVDTAGPRIYAIGDCSDAYRPAIHNILASIPVLGENIKRDLHVHAGMVGRSAGEDKVFKEDRRETQLVPIGPNKGVGVMMGWRVPSWVVWLIKGRDYWVWTTGRLWSGRMW
jgi:NADH dehydrogenase FAD-containing subunit